MEPKWSQDGAILDAKSSQKMDFVLEAFLSLFLRLLVDFGTKTSQNVPPKTILVASLCPLFRLFFRGRKKDIKM